MEIVGWNIKTYQSFILKLTVDILWVEAKEK